MTTRDELHAMRDRLETLADRPPRETSLAAAQRLADAATAINEALYYAVSEDEKRSQANATLIAAQSGTWSE